MYIFFYLRAIGEDPLYKQLNIHMKQNAKIIKSWMVRLKVTVLDEKITSYASRMQILVTTRNKLNLENLDRQCIMFWNLQKIKKR